MVSHLQQILNRAHPNGGFRTHDNGKERVDSTAWATIILSHFHPDLSLLAQSRDYLTAFQLKDGRVSLASDHPNAFWPTPLAILAWQDSQDHRSHHTQAIQFLLHISGKHWKKTPQQVYGHDPSLRGWPWIEHTHSWVEITAISMIALHRAGHANHPRMEEATHMLLDRQLPHGGWNYGNTSVFDQELYPSPEDTGAALSALSERVPESRIKKSLDYLLSESPRLRTPIALGWSLLGLNAWGKGPRQTKLWIEETFNRGKRYGSYDTASLCLLLAPLIAPNGLQQLSSEHSAQSTATQEVVGPMQEV